MSNPAVFTVPDISCEHCVTAITNEVGGVAGVSNVDVDLDAKTVSVTGGEHDAIVEAIDEAGYDVA